MCHLILLGVVLLLCQNVRLFGVRVEENVFYLKPIRCENSTWSEEPIFKT